MPGEGGSGTVEALNDLRKKSGLTCSFIIFAALNLSMLILGAYKLDECPISHMIPIYLVGRYEEVINVKQILTN